MKVAILFGYFDVSPEDFGLEDGQLVNVVSDGEHFLIRKP